MKKVITFVFGLALMAGVPAAAEDLTAMYDTLKVTGSDLEVEQVYTAGNLLELMEIADGQPELEGLCITTEYEGMEIKGLDQKRFLSLCGAEASAVSEDAVIVLSVNGELPPDGISLLTADGTLSAVDEILLGEDLHYEMHNRAPHDVSADILFTFHVYKGGELVSTTELTTTELEMIALENPEAVYGSFYGVLGNTEDIASMGTGGFLDYYEGLRFDYLMKDVLEIDNFDGYAELIGREGEIYNTIEDLGYFAMDADAYYMCTSDGDVIMGKAIPVLAYAKNGSPLLPDHEHESEGYVRSTPLKEYLKELGVEEVNLGTVKNHSGPFVAALGDCDGYYGGYQMETSGDCIQMDIYLNESL